MTPPEGPNVSHSKFQLVQESPRTITKRIEDYIARGAKEEERRAQKALILLKTRDNQISLLERRVAELENAAADLHAISLQGSPSASTNETLDNKTSYLSIPHSTKFDEIIPRHSAENNFECQLLNVNYHPHRIPMDNPSMEGFHDCDASVEFAKNQPRIRIPNLKLPMSPATDSENDVFTTPLPERNLNDNRFPRNRTSSDAIVIPASEVSEFLHLQHETSNSNLFKSEYRGGFPLRVIINEDAHDDYSLKNCNIKIAEKVLSEISGQIPGSGPVELLMAAAAMLRSIETSRAVDVQMNSGDGVDVLKNRKIENRSFVRVQGQPKSCRPVKLSSSVPWIRMKRNLRRKTGVFEPRISRVERIFQPKPFHGTNSGSTAESSRSLPPPRNLFTAPDERESTNEVIQNCAQEGRVTTGQQNVPDKKDACIQTAPSEFTEFPKIGFSNEIDGKIQTGISRSSIHLGDKKSSNFFSANDEPAPQWLIEEALNRGKEFTKNNRFDQTDHSADAKKEENSSELKYEAIISEFAEKLDEAKVELQVALKKKSFLKEKYKRALQSVKLEASKENEALQQRVVHICTSVLEKFGPYSTCGKKNNRNGSKYHKPLKCFGKLSKKLHKKLRVAFITSNNLKQIIASTKEDLKEKTEQYESLKKCFSRLKQELETTEINLNDLISENATLRKKFEDTREWMELKIGKERHEKSNNLQLKNMQKSRELMNLKKKTDEDFTIITQLRNKLLRSESANANKGFLLNSYKGQLADLQKEKDLSVDKCKELENDSSQLRNTNAQLKAKISLLSNGKDKIVTVSEKSETDLKERMATELTKKFEESVLQEMDMMKAKYDDILEITRAKLKNAENRNAEFSTALTEFLRKIFGHFGDQESETDLNEDGASQREAHVTACTILNITPDQLSGFMESRSANTINIWLSDFHKITSKCNFADALAKFLFKKGVDVRK